MKLRVFATILFVSGILLYLVFNLFESRIVEAATPLFPSSDEHPAGYYADMIRLIVTEVAWILVFAAVFFVLIATPSFQVLFNKTENLLLTNPRRTVTILLLTFVTVSTTVALMSLKTFPNSADEYAYLFQAEDLSHGKLWSEVHPLAEFFDFHHIVQKDGKWISRFPPGWPLILSIAFLLSIPPFVINIVLGTVALFLFYKLLVRIYDTRVAVWSILAVAASSYYIFNAASYFSHISSFLHVVAAMYLTILCFDKDKLWYAVVAGVFVGLLALTRPYTAVIVFAPFYFYLLVRHRRQAIMPLVLVAAGAVPCMVYLFWYNYMTTGNPRLPVTMWAYSDEALGFTRDHTPVKGLKHIFKRLCMFVYWAAPHFLILYAVFLIGRLMPKHPEPRERRSLFQRLLSHPADYFFILLIAGYFFYYEYGGNQYGPRFYFEGFPFLIAFVIIKSLHHPGMWGRILLITGIVFCIIRIPFIAARENTIVNERLDLYAKVEEAKLSNAIVFISSSTGIIRPMDEANLNRNDKEYENDVLYALDLGEENRRLMKHYPDRKFFRYERDENAVEGVISPIQADEAQLLLATPPSID